MSMVSVHTQPSSRLNVLITEDRPHPPEHWTSQLPRLLEPQGIVAYLARSGREAIDLAERVHATLIASGQVSNVASELDRHG